MYHDQETPTNHYPVPHTKKRIDAVSVCVNYGDFLVQTIAHNRHHFDRYIIVTDKKDRFTKQVCEYYRVECIQTDCFYDDGATFNKARGINAGLAKLDLQNWVVHLDSDIYLPPWTRHILDVAYLDDQSIYGIDRLMCHSYKEWIGYLAEPSPMHELYYLVQANAFRMGSRVAHYNQPDGWFPIGFFQLWNPAASGITRYPENSHNADHTDVVFAKAFPLGKRHLIPEFYGIHLDSERAKMGVNWQGRETKPFRL